MQTLRNFIRESLIIEADGDEAGSLTVGQVVQTPQDDPKQAALAAAAESLFVQHKEKIKSDVDAEFAKWPGIGPGAMISDNEVIKLRQSIADLLEKDVKAGEAYPYRTAIFLIGYDSGVTTFAEIIDKAETWGLAAAAAPVKFALDLGTQPTAGASDDYSSYLAGAGAIAVGGSGLWLLKKFAAHKVGEMILKAATPEIAGETWKSIKSSSMMRTIESPKLWRELIDELRAGTAESSKSEVIASITRAIKANVQGVKWGSFVQDLKIVDDKLITPLAKLGSSNETVTINVLQGGAEQTTNIVGQLKLPLREFSQFGWQDNTPADFTYETIRKTLRKGLSSGEYVVPDNSAKVKVKGTTEQIFEKATPLTDLFADSSDDFKATAEFLDATGNKKGEYKQFQSWLTSKIRDQIEENGGNLPKNMEFIPTAKYEGDDIPAGFKLSISDSQPVKSMIDNFVDAKSSLMKITDLFVEAVGSKTPLGRVGRGFRAVRITGQMLGLSMAALGIGGAVAGSISASLSDEELDPLTAVKIASDAKIRSEASKAFDDYLSQEPDIDIIAKNVGMFGTPGKFAEGDNALRDALALPTGGDEDAVGQMDTASNAYKTALGPSDVKESISRQLRSLVSEILRRN